MSNKLDNQSDNQSDTNSIKSNEEDNETQNETILENDVMSLSQTILVTSFDSGYFEIPIVNFGIVFENDTTIYSTSTGALFLQVYVPEVDTAQAFKPIISPFSEPYTLKEILPWVIGFLAVIIVVSLLVYYISKRRKNKQI